MKTFKFIYQDKQGNELMSKKIDCINKKEAVNIAYQLQFNSQLNDLHTIKTKKVNK